MKINKYILGLAVVVLGGFSSCNTDVEGTIYNSTFENVSFDGSSTSVAVDVNETSATIPVTITRSASANASTVTYTAEASEDGIFTDDANGAVIFEAGQNSVTFNVTASNLQKDQSYTYTLTLSDEAALTNDTITNATQNTTYTIKVSRAGDWTEWEQWNSAGTATYIYVNFWGGEDSQKFYYRQSLNNPDLYQFMSCNWGGGIDLIIYYDASTGHVTVPETYTGYDHSTYGSVNVADLATYLGEKATEEDYGTFDAEQGIITIPLVYYVSAGVFGYDPEYLYIDGYVRADYTTTVAYFGRLTDSNNVDYLLADISFSKDVEYIRYALATQDQVDATIETLTNGGGEKLTEAGRVSIPVTESGTYYLVTVAFAGGKAVASDATKIKFTSSSETAETWTALYTGTYTYTVADLTGQDIGGLYEGTVDAILYQSDSDETRYKIAPWASLTGEEGLVFTMDASGNLTVDNCFTGYTDAKYGDVFASDLITYGAADMASAYSEGVFSFNLAYHDAEGAWTFVTDTFTLTGEVAGSRGMKADAQVMTPSLPMTYCKLGKRIVASKLQSSQIIK